MTVPPKVAMMSHPENEVYVFVYSVATVLLGIVDQLHFLICKKGSYALPDLRWLSGN